MSPPRLGSWRAPYTIFIYRLPKLSFTLHNFYISFKTGHFTAIGEDAVTRVVWEFPMLGGSLLLSRISHFGSKV
jgi:hypothetical protein